MIEFKPAHLGVAAGVLAVGLFAGWLVRGLATGPTDAPTITVYDDWRLACPKRSQADLSCELTQEVIDNKSHVTLVRFGLLHQKEKPAVAITVPFNVLLPAGMGLKLGDNPMKVYSYRTCNAGGCLVLINPDDKLYDGIVHAKKIRIFFADLNAKPVAIELSLKGLNQAVTSMNDSEGKRHSWFRRAFL